MDAATKADVDAKTGAEPKAEAVPEAGTGGIFSGSGDPEALPGTGEVFPDPRDTEKDPPARVRASGALPVVPRALPALAPITASDDPDTVCPAGSSRAPTSSRCSRTVSTRYRRRSLGERYMDSSRWKGSESPENRMRTAFSVQDPRKSCPERRLQGWLKPPGLGALYHHPEGGHGRIAVRIRQIPVHRIIIFSAQIIPFPCAVFSEIRS